MYYNVRVAIYPRTVEAHVIVDGTGYHTAGSLEYVVAQIDAKILRVATLADVPPRAVLDRVGHERLAKVMRVEVNGRALWVHEYGEIHAYDEKGHKTRGKTRQAAVNIYGEAERRKYEDARGYTLQDAPNRRHLERCQHPVVIGYRVG